MNQDSNLAALNRAKLTVKHRERAQTLNLGACYIWENGKIVGVELRSEIADAMRSDDALKTEIYIALNCAMSGLLARYIKRARDLERKQRRGK